ncbi:MAG: AAA family ATPase [Pseudonocardia sp.]|nr:AAA family ATPase [Pseudonocardia sp.]
MPGSGKTTLATRLAEKIPAVRLCPDEWMGRLGVDLWDSDTRDRLERLFWEHAQRLLELGQSVILESGFWLRSDRDEKGLGARALGVAVELHYLAVPFEELCHRLEARNTRGTPGAVALSRERLAEFASYFQAPDTDELGLFDNVAGPEQAMLKDT